VLLPRRIFNHRGLHLRLATVLAALRGAR